MKHKAAVGVFLCLALLPLVLVPAFNLTGEPARLYAQKLVKERKIDRLRGLLYNADFLEAGVSRLTWRLGWSVDPSKAVVGREGWMYLGDRFANGISSHRKGATDADHALAQRISDNLLGWERWLKAQGVQGFALMIGPDKPRIYATHLPGWVSLVGVPRIRGLVSGSAQRVVSDPGPELMRMSTQAATPTYYRTDSHWNPWGGAISLNALKRTLHGQGVTLDWPFSDPPAILQTHGGEGGDLARFLRIQASIHEQAPMPLLRNQGALSSELRDTATGELLKADPKAALLFPRQIVKVTSRGAANDKKVLWLRDSFGSAQAPSVYATFSEVVQTHWQVALAKKAAPLVAMVKTHQPDIVLMTVVERAALSELFLTPPPKD
jgi:alginate O-acetyltransferase complex protein AlgJ